MEQGMKLHLREAQAGGRLFRVVTLRPGTEALFSTNYFHDTWHVLTDTAGARLLARLLWGLAYQRQPGTVVLLHGEHLCPTPFDADRSDPVLLVPEHLTPHDHGALQCLKQRLPRLGPPTRTIRWQTPGLDHRLVQPHRWVHDHAAEHRQQRWDREQCDRVGGFVCYTAPPEVLKSRAASIHRLGSGDYEYLADRGEVQTVWEYQRQVSEAVAARREVLAELEAPVDPQTLRERVWERKRLVAARAKSDAAQRETEIPAAGYPPCASFA